jgi:1-acyl-sn-glycerol-3-phosphate acyltransferase
MLTAAFYWLTTHLVHYFLLPIYAHERVTGLENIPRHGPLIIASNHLNDTDPGVLCTRIPRRLVFMTKDELFHVPGLAQFLTLYGAFPVRRHEADLAALRRCNETLKRGLALVLFPEGTRAGMRASLGQAWAGTALIALRNNVPILPVAITGSQDLALPRMFIRPFRFRHLTLTIGKPFLLEQPERLNAAAAEAGTAVIMAKIAALLPPEYRGYYGSEPPSVLKPGETEEVSG